MTLFGALIVIVIVVVCVCEFRAPERTYKHLYFDASRRGGCVEVRTNIPPQSWWGLRGGDVIERTDIERWEVKTSTPPDELIDLNRACVRNTPPAFGRRDGGVGGGDA